MYYNYVVTDIHSIGMMVPVSVIVVKILGIAIATSFLRQVRPLWYRYCQHTLISLVFVGFKGNEVCGETPHGSFNDWATSDPSPVQNIHVYNYFCCLVHTSHNSKYESISILYCMELDSHYRVLFLVINL